MKFSTDQSTAKKKLLKHMVEIYMDKPYTGDKVLKEAIMMMFVNKQGSVGVEELISLSLNEIQNLNKHGFDGYNEESNFYSEYKPSTQSFPVATYNDVTIKKINLMKTEKGNRVIFETHLNGKLIFMASVPGKLVAKKLETMYFIKKEKIDSGSICGTRQTHNITLSGFIKDFGTKSVDVLFYKPNDFFNKSTVKELNLSEAVNKLDK